MQKADYQILDFVQQGALRYFLEMSNPDNGLVADSTWAKAPASIAAVGLALASYPVAVARGVLSRQEAAQRTQVTLRFFQASRQSPEPDATGYRGFYYHFLDMQRGQRARHCELSTIDTAYLILGALIAAQFFQEDNSFEREIRGIANDLYARVEWAWALNDDLTLSHGWYPESGFIPYRWQGYDESLFLHVLALGAPQWAVPPECYDAWCSTFEWRRLYGYEYLFAAPLFIHQASQMWLDLRDIQDKPMRARNMTYVENSRRATYVQQQYAIANPQAFVGYGADAWGITASEGPGEQMRMLEGKERQFYNYLARGVPAPDDGTLSPWCVITSLPFAPEIVLPTMLHYEQTYPELRGRFGFTCSLNPTFRAELNPDSKGWFSKDFYGLNEGPNALMIENFRSGFVWQLTRQCKPIMRGFLRAGFQGGWLKQHAA